MASINSHRKAQVYRENRDPQPRRSYGGGTQKDSSAHVMSGGRYSRGDAYWAVNRYFTGLHQFTENGYLNANVSQNSRSLRTTATDPIFYEFNPGGAMSPYNRRGLIAVDSLEQNYNSPAARLLGYRRKNNALVSGGSQGYKKVGNGYKYVMNPGEYIGGNIKSRQNVAKWIAGFWRAK